MGVAKEKLTAAERRRIAGGLFTVTSTDEHKGELHGLCPNHKEEHPSFSYSWVEDVSHCFSCGWSGDLVALFGLSRGLDQRTAFKRFCDENGISRRGDPPVADPPVDNNKTQQKPPGPDLEEIWQRFDPLPPKWLRRLEKIRGWSAKAIESLDIRRQTYYLCKKTGRIKPVVKKEWRKIAIPIRDGHGVLKNIRLYQPGAKQYKLISWGKGYGKGRLFPARPGPSDPVLLCEGEADTICAISHGFNAITQTTKRMRWPKAHRKPFAGRDVVICYDADLPGQKYARAAADSLSGVASRVRLLEWPDFMGREEDGSWPAKAGDDLTDFFVKHGKAPADLQTLIEMAPEAAKEKGRSGVGPGEAAAFFAVGINDRYAFKPRLLAERILEDMDICSDPMTGILYRWNGEYWEVTYEDYIEQRAIALLGDESRSSWVKDAVNQVRKLSNLPAGRAMNDRTEWTCIKNGMFNVYTKELRAHHRDFYASFQIPVVFDPERTPRADRWVRYLEEAVQTQEVIMQLQEFAGVCLTRDVKYAKCMILVGPGSDGKSIFIKLLRKMVGPENCSAVSFNELERHFQRASLYGKVLNVSTEVGSDALQSNYFKAIVTGDPIDASYKFRDSFTFTPFAKLIFATNRMPRVLDTSDGFYRRILPVTFKQQFMGDADDKELEVKLEKELSGIFEWALIGLDRLRENKDFTWSKETEKELHNYRRLNNPVLCFTEEALEIDPDATELKDHLYQKYKDWCYDSGVKAYGKVNFFRELHNCIQIVSEHRPRVGTERPRMLKGVRYVGE